MTLSSKEDTGRSSMNMLIPTLRQCILRSERPNSRLWSQHTCGSKEMQAHRKKVRKSGCVWACTSNVFHVGRFSQTKKILTFPTLFDACFGLYILMRVTFHRSCHSHHHQAWLCSKTLSLIHLQMQLIPRWMMIWDSINTPHSLLFQIRNRMTTFLLFKSARVQQFGASLIERLQYYIIQMRHGERRTILLTLRGCIS